MIRLATSLEQRPPVGGVDRVPVPAGWPAAGLSLPAPGGTGPLAMGGKAPAILAPSSRPRLLVADDEPDMREVLTGLLEADYQVLAAADGQQALELPRTEHPDLILLDLKMPRLDGFQVLERLMADPLTSDIPVLFLSARCDDDAKVRALELGAVDYLEKPVSGRELRARMARTLRLLRSQTMLRDLARTDALTGLANVRAFRSRLLAEMKQLRRYGTPLTCIMADVDQLKPLNDELGHAAGDQAIAAVGRAIREELRETDFGARYGGDEFVALLPHTLLEAGRACAERVARKLAQTELALAGRHVKVGVSFGVACLLWDPGDGAESLLMAADRALYAAKRAGGGCVCLAPPAPGP